MRNSYNTRQKEAVRSFLAENADRSHTVSEVCAALDGVGRTTVYRALTRLVSEGEVARFPADGREGDAFQLRDGAECRRHIHYKCLKCGAVGHLDCEFMNELREHIVQGHEFELDNDKTVLYGVCAECRGRKK